jgi:hypothetical protein
VLAAALAPVSATLTLALLVACRQGQLEEAKRCYMEAIRLRPTFAIAWSNLAGTPCACAVRGRPCLVAQVRL